MNNQMIDEELDDTFGFYEGECQGCSCFGPLDDLGLCEECSAKFERDVIRQRDWDYSVLAFGVPEGEREALRQQIIKAHGERFELIMPRTDSTIKGKT
jgi:hypothetical protein